MKKTNTTTSIPVIVEPIDADGYVRPYVRTKVSDAEHAHSIAMRLLRKDSRLAAVGIFHAEFDSTLAYLYRSDFNAAVAQELQLQDRRPATGLRTESTPGMAAGIEKATNIFALLQERGGPGKPLPWWHPECLSAREARRSDLEQQLQDCWRARGVASKNAVASSRFSHSQARQASNPPAFNSRHSNSAD